MPGDHDGQIIGYWPYQDGRSSKGMVNMLEQARALRRQNKQVSVLAYDIRGLRGNEREQAMAEYIAAAREKSPQKVFIVLSGRPRAPQDVRDDRGDRFAGGVSRHLLCGQADGLPAGRGEPVGSRLA